MKRFLVFHYDTHYPDGGMNDFIMAADTEAEVLMLINANAKIWRGHFNILDSQTEAILDYIDGALLRRNEGVE